MFPQFFTQTDLTIDSLCKLQGVSVNEQQVLSDHVFLSKQGTLALSIKTRDAAAPEQLNITIEPITGFPQYVLIRGA